MVYGFRFAAGAVSQSQRRRLTAGAWPWCSLVPFVAAPFACAQQAAPAWPVKPLRIIVPFGAGGAQDTMARSLNAELGQLLGQSVIIENRVGAGGTIGTGFVAKSPPDGYTMVLAAASHTINGSLFRKLDYDPLA